MREVLDLRQLRAMASDEAAATIAARLSDSLARAEEEEVLEQWLGLDESHATAWGRTRALMEMFADPADDEILDAMREEARRAGPEERPGRLRWAIAACLVGVVFAGLLAVGIGRFGSGDVPQIARNDTVQSAPGPVIRTATGEIRTLTLPDGSGLTLDTASAVRVAFSDNRRQIELIEGRAHFRVQHAGRPFVVQAAAHEVVATGTSFDVRIDPGRFSVVLTEGRVEISRLQGGSQTFALTAGEQLVDEGGSTRIVPIENSGAPGWQNGMLTFRNEALSIVASEMNRYSKDQLVISDPQVAQMRVTGAFPTGDVSGIASAIEAIHPVRIDRAGPDRLAITRAR